MSRKKCTIWLRYIVIAGFRQKPSAMKEEDHSGSFVEVVQGLKSSVIEMELIYPTGGKLEMSSPDLSWPLRYTQPI